LDGTPVPLPDAQELNNITVDASNTEFTVTVAGRYYISFIVNTTASLLLGARVLINGAQVDQLNRAPGLSLSSFSGEAILTLAAGTTLTLELYGLLGDATLQDGLGAGLTIIRLDD
jgi:hypothetical protein